VVTDWEKREGGAYQIHGQGYRVAVNKRTDKLTSWIWIVYSMRRSGLRELARGKAQTLAAGKRLGLAAMMAYQRYAA